VHTLELKKIPSRVLTHLSMAKLRATAKQSTEYQIPLKADHMIHPLVVSLAIQNDHSHDV